MEYYAKQNFFLSTCEFSLNIQVLLKHEARSTSCVTNFLIWWNSNIQTSCWTQLENGLITVSVTHHRPCALEWLRCCMVPRVSGSDDVRSRSGGQRWCRCRSELSHGFEDLQEVIAHICKSVPNKAFTVKRRQNIKVNTQCYTQNINISLCLHLKKLLSKAA